MTTTDYISEQEFRDYIKSNADIGNPNTQTVITAASRAVDSYCGRRFYTSTETRYVSADPYQGWRLALDADLANVTDLAVLIDAANDGTYTTAWTYGTHYTAVPVTSDNGMPDWPYSELRTIGAEWWPARINSWYPETVKITGNFGWTDIPAPVNLATKILAAQFYKLADAPLGVAGFGEFGPVRVREIPQVATLLAPYCRRAGMWVSR